MGFFVSPRGENTFGSTESPSCLVCFAESPFRSLKEQEQCRIAPAACLTFSPGDAGSFSPRTHQGTSSPFIGRGSLDGGGKHLIFWKHCWPTRGAGPSRHKRPSKHLHGSDVERGQEEKSKKERSRPPSSPHFSRNFFTQLRSWKRGCDRLLLLLLCRQPRLNG